MNTMTKKNISIIAFIVAAAIFAALLLPGNVYAATGTRPVNVKTKWTQQNWTKLCDTKENRAQYVRIDAMYPVNLDVKMTLKGGKVWTENNAVKVKKGGMCVRDFYVGKNVTAIYVRVNRGAITHYMTKQTLVDWQNVGKIRYN